MSFSEKIMKRRTELNLSQKQLAEKIFVTQQSLSKWENGLSLPQLDRLEEISESLNCSIFELLFNGEPNYKMEIDYTFEFMTYIKELQQKDSSDIISHYELILAENALKQNNGAMIHILMLSDFEKQLYSYYYDNESNSCKLNFWKTFFSGDYKYCMNKYKIEATILAIHSGSADISALL